MQNAKFHDTKWNRSCAVKFWKKDVKGQKFKQELGEFWKKDVNWNSEYQKNVSCHRQVPRFEGVKR